MLTVVWPNPFAIRSELYVSVFESFAHCILIWTVEFGPKLAFWANLGFHVTMYLLPT